MATHENGYSQLPDPKVVGTEFVKQYYNIVHSKPEDGHKFYQDISEMLRPGPDGQMTSVTTMQGIDEKILSLDFDKSKIEILSADAQASFKGGFLVLVTGYITMAKDKVKRTFTQSFFLAPQANGYYVHSDIFRYVEDEASAPLSPTVAVHSPTAAADEDVTVVDVPVTPYPEPAQVSVEHESLDVPSETVVITVTESDQSVDSGLDSVSEKETVANSSAELNPGDVVSPVVPSSPVTETAVLPVPASPIAKANAPKPSYASIVHALSSNSQPFQVRVSPAKVAEKRPSPSPTTSEASVPNGVPAAAPAAVKPNAQQPVKRYSIFVGNLPLDATPAQLEEAFMNFGPIKQEGIQVRSSKGSCYGFVEFEAESSLCSALEGISVLIGNKKAHIEEQRTDGNDRGKFRPGRGGFRGDNYRGRGGFAVGRSGGYGRNDFEKKLDFAGPGRGGRNGGGYSRDFQNGAAPRGPRQETTGVKN